MAPEAAAAIEVHMRRCGPSRHVARCLYRAPNCPRADARRQIQLQHDLETSSSLIVAVTTRTSLVAAVRDRRTVSD